MDYYLIFMPHTFSELQAMSENDVRALAAKFEIKNAGKRPVEQLIPEILDLQAVIESKKPESERPAKKRGRPRKEKTEEVVEKPAEKPEQAKKEP